MGTCLMHGLRDSELHALRGLQCTNLIFCHGRHDLIAGLKSASQLANSLHAPCVVLDAAHYVSWEKQEEVNALLLDCLPPKHQAWAKSARSLAGQGVDTKGKLHDP